MLRIYTRNADTLVHATAAENADAPVWLDLINPDPEDRREAERLLAIDIPTRAEAEEIELSARLYTEDGAVFMTMTGLVGLDTDSPSKTPITFILKDKTLATIRYAEPKSFAAYLHRATGTKSLAHRCGRDIMIGLLEAVVDRTADALEKVGAETDTMSREAFKKDQTKVNKKTHDLENLIVLIGQKSELLTMIQESLLSLTRIMAYYASGLDNGDKQGRQLVRLIQRDASALGDHTRTLSARLDFLLNATLGLINLEQNQIIKIFSVASVAFLPPTLIASAYGMNFDIMPELQWTFGYPSAVALMVISALLPYLYFRRKGWL